MMAVGVAKPKAHGQAMISTATKTSVAKVKAGSGPNSSQKRNAAKAAAMTDGTKTEATRSAKRWMGAFEAWASSTSRMIWASTVSPATFRTR